MLVLRFYKFLNSLYMKLKLEIEMEILYMKLKLEIAL